jgi:predicted RNase H-like HicB family nuclease
VREIVVRYHHEPEGWWAESDDLPGWSAAGDTFAEVRELAYQGVPHFVGSAVAVSDDLSSVHGDLVELRGSLAAEPTSSTLGVLSSAKLAFNSLLTGWPSAVGTRSGQ